MSYPSSIPLLFSNILLLSFYLSTLIASTCPLPSSFSPYLLSYNPYLQGTVFDYISEELDGNNNYDIPLHQGSAIAYSNDSQYFVVGAKQSTLYGGMAFVYKYNKTR